MKKQTLLLLAGGMLAVASCNNNAGDAGMSQASIDSMVNARVEEIRTEMMKQNDSLINAMATFKADSIIEAMKSGNKPAPKPVVKSKPVSTSGGTHGTSTISTTSSTPSNSGKNTGAAGANSGKVGSQTEGANTGKKK